MFTFGDPGSQMPYFVSTLASDMEDLMAITHARQRISAFAGPVGIGKSRAVEHFEENRSSEVIVITAKSQPTRTIETLYEIAQAIRRKAGQSPLVTSSGKSSLNAAIREARQQWWTTSLLAQPCGENNRGVRQTLILEEAQNYAPKTISSIRYFNDRDNLGLNPLGMIFVGNSEFSLMPSGNGSTPLSLAVADRMLYRETYTYAAVTNEDVRRHIEGYGVVPTEVIALMIKNLERLLPRLTDGTSQRSYRNIDRLLNILAAAAKDGPMTVEAFREAFPK